MAKPKKQIVWTPHQDPYLKARAAFSVAHMSNFKWRKVLRAIATADLNLSRSEWKCIDSTYVMIHGIPHVSDIQKARFADGQFQPFEYKWIKWVHFPRRYKPYPQNAYEVEQDVDSLKQRLENCGQLRLFLDQRRLSLLAYERSTAANE